MRKGRARNGGLLPSSLRIISSCLKTVSTNATAVASTVRSAASISSSSEDHKDHVTWAGFDRLQLAPLTFRRVLLLGYQNGFQVLDVEDASNFSELVSRRDGPVSFLQMQPSPAKRDDKGFISSHPLLLVVAGKVTDDLHVGHTHSHLGGPGGGKSTFDPKSENCVTFPTSVRFYSLHSNNYVHVLRFRSAVLMVRCSPRIVAVGLATQIYCIDALTLENKFSVLTYPVPRMPGQGTVGVNIGYGPMAVGDRWLAFASNSPLLSSTGRLSPQNRSPSPGVSPSTSPGGTSLVARCAMESSRQLAAGVINLGDMGYKTLSRYCHELLPDGSSSPGSSSSGCKVGRPAETDLDNAGMVVLKDFVSQAVISQFKAHTSPISALCFDPSGTLLVTASVYGNNINVFRIMPSYSEGVAGVQSYNWSSSHVHLYKLHRGLTSAVIQDICFSSYSQWIAIVSAKGTCHIFVLSPFGGDPGFHSLNSSGEDSSLHPFLSLPWWYTSACMTSQQSSPPPPPVSLSVVSRIKYSSFGWLSTIGNANGVTEGKIFVPSGAVAAIFHNSMLLSTRNVDSNVKPLEHLLVYTPSGHVVQHELLSAIGLEARGGGSRSHSASFVPIQDDDLKVRVEPVQWWDVCRRSDWPEREECTSGTTEIEVVPRVLISDLGSAVNLIRGFVNMNDDFAETNIVKSCNASSNEKSHWFLSNAEVQISTGRLPILQKNCFFVMYATQIHDFGHGELEIEKVPSHEIKIKQTELLPVFDHLSNFKSCWSDRIVAGRRCASQSAESHQLERRVAQETVICHSQPASISSTGSSECGSSRRTEHLIDLDQINPEKAFSGSYQTLEDFFEKRSEGIGASVDVQCASVNNATMISAASASLLEHPNRVDSQNYCHIATGLGTSLSKASADAKPFSGGPKDMNASNAFDDLESNTNSCDSNTQTIARSITLPVDVNLNKLNSSSPGTSPCPCGDDPVAHAKPNNSQCGIEKAEEDGEIDEAVGGIFPFHDEGSTWIMSQEF